MVYIDVSKPEDVLWTNYPPSQRTTIRQALKNGLTSRLGAPDELKSVFLPIYQSTMNFVSASDRYYFSEPYFDFLAGVPESFFDLLIIEKESRSMAAALFFKGSDFYHYHLSGSLPEFRDFRPNNLLLHEASLRAHRLGLTKFHLGGGRTTATDDALFKFKASFSNLRAEFHIGETIHQPEAYEQVCQNWLRQAAQAERPASLLFYRTPLPSST
jgi:lipid II:glycine glycyltransferase (peptidoglycan interpeptide bridge formation enzyme)